MQAETGAINFTPYALANMSEDLYSAAQSLAVGERFPLAHFFLYSVSIELGLKSALLDADNSAARKAYLKSGIGHDMIQAHNAYLEMAGRPLFNADDLTALGKLNRFYMGKRLEYFTLEMIFAATTAYSEFADLSEIQICANKVRDLLASHKNYRV